MAFENLPGIFPNLIDGNLLISSLNENPIVLVIGTAARGDSENLYNVTKVSQAVQDFGRQDGTLVRGLYEAIAGGAENIRLYRIGATSAKLELVGGGITIETQAKDDTAGVSVKIFWDDTTGRLRVWRVSDNELVYDNNPVYPSGAIDLQVVSVYGVQVGTPGSIGTADTPVTLVDADGVSGADYTAGTDGITLSRMELFEALFKAYKLLENQDLDIIIPQNVYMDDENVQDMTTAEVTAVNTGAPWLADPVYPVAGSFYDVLGRVFAQEFEGEWHFWWKLDRADDGVANIYPDVGLADEDKDAFGNELDNGSFHEANFAYQLADFCYRQSEDNAEMIGMIGVLPPNSWSLRDVSNWVGRSPTYTEDNAGNLVVSVNGSGLLGNKWKAGRLASGGTGLPGHIVDSINGLAYGGFIATDDGWPDGDQQTDRNDRLIDLGKYISIVAAQAVLSNQSHPTAYAATGATIYGGFVSGLRPNSAPTNKIQPGVRLPFRVAVSKLDDLAGLGYVMFQRKPKGIVVADAPTASRPDSDYRRLTTIRIVKATIDAIRAVAEPFLGEPITGARLAALETAIDQVLVKLMKAEFLQRYDVSVTSTPTQQIQGKADVELVLVPAFELRQITINVALAAQ